MMESKLFTDMPSPPIAPRLPREFMDPQQWTRNHLLGALAILIIAVLSIGFATHYYFPYNYMEICHMIKDFFKNIVYSIFNGIFATVFIIVNSINSLVMTGIRFVAEHFPYYD